MIKQPIGVMDSGAGGLTVAKAIKERFPNEDMIYVGDTANCPYGTQTTEQICAHVQKVVDFLLQKNIKILIIACNTATVAALPMLQRQLSIPVIGMLDAGTTLALQATKNQKIGVLATDSTVNSQQYVKLLQEKSSMVDVYQQACQSFVEMVESNRGQSKEAFAIAKMLITPFVNTTDVDTLILGCTHFPLMRDAIQKAVPTCTLVDPAIGVAEQLTIYLTSANEGKGHTEIYLTASEKTFHLLAEECLNEKVEIKEVIL